MKKMQFHFKTLVARLPKDRKRRRLLLAVLLGIGVIAVGLLLLLHFKTGNQKNPDNRMNGMFGGEISGDRVAASGVTSVGMAEESFEVENLSVPLEVEEVYVNSGDTVAAGDKIAKFSEESISEAREELEETLLEAELAYRAGKIAYEQNKITAEYEHDSTVLNGKQAEAVYDATVESLEASVEKAEKELADAQEEIAEYEAYADGDDAAYREYFKVDKYKNLYDTNLEVLIDKMEEWQISWTQVAGGSTQLNGLNQTTVSGGNAGMDVTSDNASETVSTQEYASRVQTLASMYKVLEQNGKDYEQALEKYEDAKCNAPFTLQTLQLQLPSLEEAVLKAKENYDTQLLQAELTYKTALSSAETAESDYETALEKAESDYTDLEQTYTDAKENLAQFEESVGDGYFHASGAGSILRTMIKADSEVYSQTVIFVYSDVEEMTVTVSVGQSDIAKLSLGESAFIQSSEYGSYEGKVTKINPVSNSSSRSNVTYEVTVAFTGDTGDLPANESVLVLFGEAENGDRAEMPKDAVGESMEEAAEEGTEDRKNDMPKEQ